MQEPMEVPAPRRKSRSWSERSYRSRVINRMMWNHGITRGSAEFWFAILTHNNTRCDICGIPLWKLKSMIYFKHGGLKCNGRLSLDHTTPGVNDDRYRPLCYSCNCARGSNDFTDAEVLDKMIYWYENVARIPLR